MQLMFGKVDVTMKELDAKVDRQITPSKTKGMARGDVSGEKGKYGENVVEVNKLFNRDPDEKNAKRSVKTVEKLELRLSEQETKDSD